VRTHVGTTAARRKFWGWGLEGTQATDAEVRELAQRLHDRFGIQSSGPVDAPKLSDITLRDPRVVVPATLAGFCSVDKHDRAEHTLGKSMRDFVIGLERRYDTPPDFVAFPCKEADVVAVLDWANDNNVAVIPFGGGSSVADGIDPGGVGDDYAGVVSLDLRQLNQVLDLDRDSRSALIQTGVLGPALEDQLRPHGLSMRFYMQAFEFSSLGGWIATRAAGHFANLHTQIDDYVQGLRVVTPRGAVQTRRLPSDGAGVSADRLFIGSEGTLGVITEAWMRLQDRPKHRASASFRFRDFEAAWKATRAVAQSGLWPANCRLLNPVEAAFSGAGDGKVSILIVAFESADHPMDAWMARGNEIVLSYGGVVSDASGDGQKAGEADRWRDFFIRGPYLKEAYARLGIIRETFETACTWRDWPEFHAGVVEATQKAVDAECGRGTVACRLTHVYPDGPAPYYTVLAPARRGAELQQWAAIKEAASEAVLRLGGTITHHHAVGRYHRPWYDQQRPDLFAEALGAAKQALDPAGILNPGVLIDPNPRE